MPFEHRRLAGMNSSCAGCAICGHSGVLSAVQPLQFPDALNVMSFVNGHVGYIKIYWNGIQGPDGFSAFYEPPDGYDYKWSGN